MTYHVFLLISNDEPSNQFSGGAHPTSHKRKVPKQVSQGDLTSRQFSLSTCDPWIWHIQWYFDTWHWGVIEKFWSHLLFPQYASGGATCPRDETVVFLLAYFLKINLHISSHPDMLHDHWYLVPTICDPLGPINFTFH
jgi:hypothetical protein